MTLKFRACMIFYYVTKNLIAGKIIELCLDNTRMTIAQKF